MTHPPGNPREREEAQQREALATLDALKGHDTFASSALARTARRAGDHFAGRDAEEGDRVELWGRRIGRVLSLIGLVVLAVYLYVTYFAR
jgi:hypothetical protein